MIYYQNNKQNKYNSLDILKKKPSISIVNFEASLYSMAFVKVKFDDNKYALLNYLYVFLSNSGLIMIIWHETPGFLKRSFENLMSSTGHLLSVT